MLNEDVKIDFFSMLPRALQDDVELLEKCYATGDMQNPVFGSFRSSVKKAARCGRITDNQARWLFARYGV